MRRKRARSLLSSLCVLVVLSALGAARESGAVEQAGEARLRPGKSVAGPAVDSTQVPNLAALLIELGPPGVVTWVERWNRVTQQSERCEYDGAGLPVGAGCASAVVPGEAWYVRGSEYRSVPYSIDAPCPPVRFASGQNLVALTCVSDGLTAFDLLRAGRPAVTRLRTRDPDTGIWLVAMAYGQALIGTDFPIFAGQGYELRADAAGVLPPPEARAGLDRTELWLPGSRLTLDSRASSDPDDSVGGNRIEWTLTPPPGSVAALDARTIASPSFLPDVAGTYLAELVVWDDFTASQDDVSVVVLDPAAGPDSDRDGLSDAAEAVVGSDPALADTDLDGFSDADEVTRGSDPLDRFELPGNTLRLTPSDCTAPSTTCGIQEAIDSSVCKDGDGCTIQLSSGSFDVTTDLCSFAQVPDFETAIRIDSDRINLVGEGHNNTVLRWVVPADIECSQTIQAPAFLTVGLDDKTDGTRRVRHTEIRNFRMLWDFLCVPGGETDCDAYMANPMLVAIGEAHHVVADNMVLHCFERAGDYSFLGNDCRAFWIQGDLRGELAQNGSQAVWVSQSNFASSGTAWEASHCDYDCWVTESLFFSPHLVDPALLEMHGPSIKKYYGEGVRVQGNTFNVSGMESVWVVNLRMGADVADRSPQRYARILDNDFVNIFTDDVESDDGTGSPLCLGFDNPLNCCTGPGTGSCRAPTGLINFDGYQFGQVVGNVFSPIRNDDRISTVGVAFSDEPLCEFDAGCNRNNIVEDNVFANWSTGDFGDTACPVFFEDGIGVGTDLSPAEADDNVFNVITGNSCHTVDGSGNPTPAIGQTCVCGDRGTADNNVTEGNYNSGSANGPNPPIPVAALPLCSSTNAGRARPVLDGVSASDCTIGGGSSFARCFCDGSQWLVD